MGNQRWLEGHDSYRPPAEVIRTRDYEVSEIPDDTTARAFVEAHHYSATYPAARFRHGLYRGAELVGVAVFSVPMNERTITSALPLRLMDAADLGRFVLLDQVPGNGETWFLARCFELLRLQGLRGVVSSSDPMPRATARGRVVMPGHVGTIYQAHNAVYLGRSTARTLHLLPDGRVFSARAAQKIRRQERGWRYAVEQLVSAGARKPRGDLGAWLRRELGRIARRVRHQGNHKYAWALDRRLRASMAAPAGGYPKRVDDEGFQLGLFGGAA